MEGLMEVELMVTKRDDDDVRVNIEQSASGRWTGRVSFAISQFLPACLNKDRSIFLHEDNFFLAALFQRHPVV